MSRNEEDLKTDIGLKTPQPRPRTKSIKNLASDMSHEETDFDTESSLRSQNLKDG